jgi:hypothetical protein
MGPKVYRPLVPTIAALGPILHFHEIDRIIKAMKKSKEERL